MANLYLEVIKMQFEGATDLELRLSSIINRCETEMPASSLETDIVVALSDAANELQRLRGHWPPNSQGGDQLSDMMLSKIEQLEQQLDAERHRAADLQRKLDEAEAGAAGMRSCLKEVLDVVDEAYQATGYIKVSKTSEQRLRFEAALATNAGAALAERLRRLETFVGKVKLYKHMITSPAILHALAALSAPQAGEGE